MTLSRAILDRCGDIAIRHAGRVALAYAVLIGVALLGASRLGFTHEPLEWFPEDDDYRVASELLNDSLDGSMFLEVLIDTGVENGLHDPALMRGLDEMRLAASNVRTRSVHVGKTLSIADVLKETHQALNENRPEYYAIPGERQLVAQELLLFENSGSDDLDDFSDPLFSKARFNVKVPFADALEYEPFVEMAEAEFAGILGSHVEITTTGLLALLGRTFRAMTFSMAKTYVVAFAIITPLMILLIGSVRIGLISMIPNLTPILFALGFMGWVGLPLDLFTLLIGCIAIGLAVDDTIHFMHGFRRFRERTGDAVGAVKATLETTGQALLFTSLVLSGGFFVFTMASMHNLATFGLLTGFTILMAFLADVLLAPALMVLLYGRQSALATDAS